MVGRTGTVGLIAALGAGAATALATSQDELRAQLRAGQSLHGTALWLPWALLVVLALAAVVATCLYVGHAQDNARLTEANGQLDLLAHVDDLTGAWNRRHIARLLREAHAAGAGEHSLAVLMIDVDHFKRINDTFGHAAGDKTLITVVGRLSASLRQGDLLGRWGGEEFLVVLPRTDLFAAQLVAERLREAVGSEPVPVGTGGDEIGVSVSVGVAASAERSPELLVHAADRALYAAKEAGRDRVRT